MKRTHWVLLFLLTITAVLPLSRATSQADKTGGEPVTAAAPLPRLSTNPARYIIQLNTPPLASVMGQARPTAVSQYQKILDAQQAVFLTTLSQELGRSVEPLFRYTVAYNGMTIILNGTEAAQVAEMSEVTAVTPDREETLLTDAGPAWINADAIWDGSGIPGGTPGKGEGVIIGVIDTGISMDHPSFAAVGGDGYVHQNPLGDGNYKGVCDPASSQYDPAFTCNAKLIGAWDFADVYGESDGPEDSNGHGSHTASTAAGNIVNATLTAPAGYTYLNDISGVAPHANIIAYDACVNASCPSSSLLAAVNQAVADGVDVISYSISGGTSPYADPVEQAFLAANEAGVIVSAAAGNNGPDPSTLSHQGPWVMTVGASTHNRVFRNSLINFNSSDGPLADTFGESLTTGYGPAPIVYAGDFGDGQCLNAFPPETWNGEIVVCDRGVIARVQKAENVLAGGAGGYVLANTAVEGDSLSSDAYALPGVHITYADGLALKNWLASGSSHTAQIGGTTAVFDNTAADKMASFSSRGPSTAMDVIKPDIAAPGVNILAADKTTQVLAPPEFGLKSGTSMATPHMSGAAALLRQVQPAWTPDEIRSALMMTAVSDAIQKENSLTANPFDRGAGRVDLSRAAQAGLVLHETRANYDAAQTGDPTALNLPSLAQSDCFQNCNWTRTFRST
ncbi:MAG: S8 family serine peptidase, partial [Chloroflexi bacterium]|nr:S8 family serine peptidase [Chloroflexota bacterium]